MNQPTFMLISLERGVTDLLGLSLLAGAVA